MALSFYTGTLVYCQCQAMADLKEHIITRLLLFGSLTVIEAVLFNKEENVGWPFEYKEVGLLVGQAKF